MKFYSVALKEFVDKLFQKHILLWPKLYIQEWQNSLKTKMETSSRQSFTVTMFLLLQIFIRLSVIYWFQSSSIEKK